MNLEGFIPWFLSEFLPPAMPWVIAIAVVVSIAFWGSVVFGGVHLVRRWRQAWRR